jgi:hypothetical protein
MVPVVLDVEEEATLSPLEEVLGPPQDVKAAVASSTKVLEIERCMMIVLQETEKERYISFKVFS